MPNQRLIDFPERDTPSPTDIIYLGDTSDSGRESRSTVNQVAAADTVNLKVANNLSDVDDASDARDNLGLTIGVDVEAHSDALDSIAGLTTAANQMLFTTDVDTYAVGDGDTIRPIINAQKTMIAQKFDYVGGSTSVVIPYTGMTSDWCLWGNLESCAAGGSVSIKRITPDTDQFGVVFTADPGVSVITWFGIEGQQG